jgi:hypothetical protein
MGSGRDGKWKGWEVEGMGSGRDGKWKGWEVEGIDRKARHGLVHRL